jgi:hypothetical protein
VPEPGRPWSCSFRETAWVTRRSREARSSGPMPSRLRCSGRRGPEVLSRSGRASTRLPARAGEGAGCRLSCRWRGPRRNGLPRKRASILCEGLFGLFGEVERRHVRPVEPPTGPGIHHDQLESDPWLSSQGVCDKAHQAESFDASGFTTRTDQVRGARIGSATRNICRSHRP